MRAKDDRSWWNMILTGSTITMEAWDMKYKPNSDWNHAWGAAPANIIPRYLWGVQPQTPGFQSVNIRPQMGDLKFANIKVPTIRGSIVGSYTRVNNNLKKYVIEMPANMVGDFEIEKTSDSEVTINGQKVNTNFRSIRLSPGINSIAVKVNTF